MKEKVLKTGVKLGEFPFPLTDGPEESRYLTWIRNHSNYMAVRGLFDYMRAVAVLMRGIAVNLLVLLPYLLLVAVLVAVAEFLRPNPSFELTGYLLLIGAAWTLFFPLMTPFFRRLRHGKSQESGSDSSVKMREWYERSFGVFLVGIPAVAVFESMPWLRERFHGLVYGSPPTLMDIGLPVLGGVLVLLVAFKLGGLAQKLALLAVGAIGVLLPLFIVLYVSDYILESGSFRFHWLRDMQTRDWGFSTHWLAEIQWDHLLWTRTDGPLIWMALLFPAYIVFLATDIRIAAFLLGVLVLPIPLFYSAIWSAYGASDRPLIVLLIVTAALLILLVVHVIKKFTANSVWRSVRKLGGLTYSNFLSVLVALVPLIAVATYLTFSPLSRSMKRDLRAPLGRAAARLAEDPNHPAIIRDFVLGESEAHVGEDSLVLESTLSTLKALSDGRYVAEYVSSLETILNEGSKSDVSSEESERLRGSIDANHERLEKLLGADLLKVATGIIQSDSVVSEDLSDNVREYRELIGSTTRVARTVDYRLRELLGQTRRDLAALASFEEAYPSFYASDEAKGVRDSIVVPKALYVSALAISLWLLSWLTVDVNLTSAHSLYRDRLAAAYLIGVDTRGDVDVEEDLDLAEICRHEAGSKAPYHLINAALNLQGSKDIGLRDRKSDFFIFSKKFIGGHRCGYCRSATMEQVHPETGLSTAMAISAAAASPAMGTMTSPLMSAIMALLNIRLGVWLPNPGLLEEKLARTPWRRKRRERKPLGYRFARDPAVERGQSEWEDRFDTSSVFKEELAEIQRRWVQLRKPGERKLSPSNEEPIEVPTVAHDLVGIAFSGGGIRSATLNLGIVQALHKYDVFDHVDYMSTVSGGGYLGSSLSALMRRRTPTASEVAGTISYAEFESGKKVLSIKPGKPPWLTKLPAFVADRLEGWVWPPTARPEPNEDYTYRYENDASFLVEEGEYVERGRRLVDTRDLSGKRSAASTSFADRMRWRVRPEAFLREMLGSANETQRSVNVSDGGHIENLATIELLRRRCKYIIIGDGEADPKHHFGGLATLIRLASIDLGIKIDIDLSPLKLEDTGLCERHWVVGTIHYPGEADEPGYLLYLKSSVCGKENVVIEEYRHKSPSFPHESTADQFFGEGQFEAYRSLGQHIAEAALEQRKDVYGKARADGEESLTFDDLGKWFENLLDVSNHEKESMAHDRKAQFESTIKVPGSKDSVSPKGYA